MMESFLDGKVQLLSGDCREQLKLLADNSVDAACMDPPYALVSIGKRFGKDGAAPAKHGTDGLYARASAGFMGQDWDTGETVFAMEFWQQVLRVLKPGAHLFAFSGTRTYHRMACAIEDAGFEIRDQLGWVYGSGFPKSHNQTGEWQGWGSALKPAWEPICLARKPLTGTIAGNLAEWGVGALNIDGCRVPSDERLTGSGARDSWRATEGRTDVPAHAGNVNDGLGRWPANLIHDGSAEVLAAFPDAGGQQARSIPGGGQGTVYGDVVRGGGMEPRGDEGSAARFFYSAKADGDDRLGSKHPTVKPVDVMQWLCRLITPPGGLVLDAFAGTGTTGEAAFREGFRAVLIERSPKFQDDIRKRMALALRGTAARKRAARKTKSLPIGGMFGDE